MALFVFIIFHLLGNLQLFYGTPEPFNKYSDFLISLEGIIYILEIGILLSFLFHAVLGTVVWLNKKRARPEDYCQRSDAGSPSHKTISSTTMIWTGLIVFIFTVIHVITFKYGPGIQEGYIASVNGKPVRDLHRLVVETFTKPGYMIGYVAAMIFLGFHLRHAFWSAFQSLGIGQQRLTSILYTVGVLLAIVLALGFLIIPVWIYFKGGIA